MGYGGTVSATANVDIVQADVQAIVQGIAGSNSYTIENLYYPLQAIVDTLSDNDTSRSIAQILVSHDDRLVGIYNVLSGLSDSLYDFGGGRPLAQVMTSIESVLMDIRTNTGG